MKNSESTYTETLEYLVKLKKQKKGKNPSRIESDNFCTAWVGLALEEGYSQKVEQFLYNGVTYSGAKPFKFFLCKSENKEDTLQKFFRGKLFGKDNTISCRLTASLLAQLLNDRKNSYLIPNVISQLLRVSVNKDKQRLGTLDSAIDKYFFGELDPNIPLIPLKNLDIKPAVVAEFSELIKSAASHLDSNSIKKSKIKNIDRILCWLNEYESEKVGTDNNANIETPKHVEVQTGKNTNTEAPKPVETKTASAPVQVKQPDSAKQIPDNTPTDSGAILAGLLAQSLTAVHAVRKELTAQRETIENQAQALEESKQKTLYIKNKFDEAEETIKTLQGKISELSSELYLMNTKVSEQEKTISAKESEIAERTKMADILSRDREKQSNEALQRIASKLRTEYTDFSDALELPMTVDLGENMRDQLSAVFDILQKGGLNIK